MVGCALAYWTRSDFTQVSKYVKEKDFIGNEKGVQEQPHTPHKSNPTAEN